MSRRQLLRFLILQEGVLALLAFTAARWWDLALWRGWSWGWSAWMLILSGTAGLLGINALIWWTSEAVRNGLRLLFDEVLAPLRPPDFALVALISGIAEEVAFRGVLQPQIGIVATSVVFAALHVPGRRLWFYGLWALFASFCLGNLYAWSGNLFVPIGIHVLNNFVSLWAWHLGRQHRREA